MLSGMGTDDYTADELAAAVTDWRLDHGLSVAAAAREAKIDRVTWKRIEDGLTVHDVKRHAVEKLLGVGDGRDRAVHLMPNAQEVVETSLNPDLADYTDGELLEEVRRRLLLLASRLDAHGESVLTWTLDHNGERVVTSATPLLVNGG